MTDLNGNARKYESKINRLFDQTKFCGKFVPGNTRSKKRNSYFSADIAKRLEKKNQLLQGRAGTLKKKNSTLSSREAEVLQLIAEGKANKEISSQLEISIKTVKKHASRLWKVEYS